MLHPKTLRLCALALLSVGATAAHAELIYGITNTNLVSFDSAAPAGFTTGAAISGLVAGHALRGIDFRPATGELYAVSAVTSATTGAGQIYTVNLATGALTAVGSTFSLLGTSVTVSIDFNPTLDRIRLVDGNENNLRIDPITGAVTVDTNLAWAAGDVNFGDNPNIAGIAYTNSVAGATSTTLYGYDFLNDALATINPPNNGTLNSVGPTAPFSAAASATVGFDISGATGTGYISGNNIGSGGTSSEFFTIDLLTGATTQIGANQSLGSILDISVQPTAAVPEPATMAALGLGAAALLRRRRNRTA